MAGRGNRWRRTNSVRDPAELHAVRNSVLHGGRGRRAADVRRQVRPLPDGVPERLRLSAAAGGWLRKLPVGRPRSRRRAASPVLLSMVHPEPPLHGPVPAMRRAQAGRQPVRNRR